MKRKVIAVIMISILMSACGSAESNKDQQINTTIIADESKEDAEKNTEETVMGTELINTHKVPGNNIVIDAPNYQNIELGYTELYIIHENKYVSITAGIPEDEMDLLKAHELAYNEFMLNMSNYNFGELAVTNEEYVTINGIDMYRYEGTISVRNETESHDGYALGYSFIMDGVPCTVGGAVLEEAQSEETIKEIHDTVEAMILTLRSER